MTDFQPNWQGAYESLSQNLREQLQPLEAFCDGLEDTAPIAAAKLRRRVEGLRFSIRFARATYLTGEPI